MYKTLALSLSFLAFIAACSTATFADQPAKKGADKTKSTTTESAKKGEKPAASPGWVIIEEEWWVPFRFDFSESLHNARVHFRRGEEKGAAQEIRKAIGWLEFAKGHATDLTRPKLQDAISDLNKLAVDLENGELKDAAHLDNAFAKASLALAEHHYFKADSALSNSELEQAGQHLMAAAGHIQHAASSANYEYSVDMAKLCDDIIPSWSLKNATTVLNMENLKQHLDTVKAELDKLGKRLEKPSAK
jgi:hypothetical protein